MITGKSTKNSETFQRWKSNVKNTLMQSKIILMKNLKTEIEINNQMKWTTIFPLKNDYNNKKYDVNFFLYSINLYPTPRTEKKCLGSDGSFSNILRKVTIKLSIVLVEG